MKPLGSVGFLFEGHMNFANATAKSTLATNPYWRKLLLASTLVGGAAVFLGHYFTNVIEKPSLYYKADGSNSVIQAVVDSCESLKEFYYPTPWCYSGHLNTIMGSIVRLVPQTEARR